MPSDAARRAAGDVGVMFFLLRMAFWLSLVLILLPTGSTRHENANDAVGPSQAVSAAAATVGDLRQFCTRQPDACTVGAQMATELGYKAQAGAKMLYEFLTEALAAHDAGSATGTTGAAAGPSNASSQNTLTPADLAPVWRGPAPRKAGKHAA